MTDPKTYKDQDQDSDQEEKLCTLVFFSPPHKISVVQKISNANKYIRETVQKKRFYLGQMTQMWVGGWKHIAALYFSVIWVSK